MLVKHILYRLVTLDGYENSGLPILQKMNERDFDEYVMLQREEKRKPNFFPSPEESKTVMNQITSKNRLKILRTAYLRYLIVKFRQKISFIAFKYKMTIVELFLHAIIKSYNQMI